MSVQYSGGLGELSSTDTLSNRKGYFERENEELRANINRLENTLRERFEQHADELSSIIDRSEQAVMKLEDQVQSLEEENTALRQTIGIYQDRISKMNQEYFLMFDY